MAYVYDLILNFNRDYYAFYEWSEDDYIWHIKKINLVKVNINTFDDFLTYNLVLSSDFVETIFNKSEYYTRSGNKIIPYAFLVTDSYRVMGIILDNTRRVIKYSSLLLDEEEDVLELANKLPLINLKYEKLDRKKQSALTREEGKIQSFIEKELLKTNNIDKLKYLYYEYYGRNALKTTDIKKELLDEVLNNFNEKHINLYHLIKLSLHQNNV